MKRWAVGQDAEVKWYRDQFTGKTMDRPGFQKLMNAVREETVSMVVVWRLDAAARLGRG